MTALNPLIRVGSQVEEVLRAHGVSPILNLKGADKVAF